MSDLYIVGTEGGYCLMDAYGNMKTKCYSEIRKSVNGYAAFKAYDDWGLIDSEGNLVIDCCYDHIDPFKCDYTSARKRVNWTIVKKKGC